MSFQTVASADFVPYDPGAPNYQYTPLRNQSATRLCVLHPGQKEEPIACSLVEVDLDKENPHYTALSYTWGDSSRPARVHCGGCQVAVTASLHSALSRLRAAEPRVLWADGLCIDQSDDGLHDRERQVKMMDQIFSKAHEVLVDLGESNEHSNAALEAMSLSWTSHQEPNVVRGAEESRSRQPDSRDPPWVGFKEIVSRKWFLRMWIIQEYVLARDVRLMVGKQTIDYDALLSFAGNVALGKNKFNKDSYVQALNQILQMKAAKGLHRLQLLSAMRKSYSDGQSARMIDLIGLSRYFDATVDRDRIYALLGLASDASRVSVD